MRYGGEGRSRLLLIILIVTSLFLITLDLRGVKILDGLRSGTQNVLSPFQKAGSTVVSPFRDFFGDVTHLGRTRNEIEKLKKLLPELDWNRLPTIKTIADELYKSIKKEQSEVLKVYDKFGY